MLLRRAREGVVVVVVVEILEPKPAKNKVHMGTSADQAADILSFCIIDIYPEFGRHARAGIVVAV